MSSSAKTGIILVVILAIIMVLWLWRGDLFDSSPKIIDNSPITEVINTPKPVSKLEALGMTVSTDITNESLEKDITAVESQISAFGQDGATVEKVSNNP